MAEKGRQRVEKREKTYHGMTPSHTEKNPKYVKLVNGFPSTALFHSRKGGCVVIDKLA
jgi:hypothetical protein